MQKDEPNYKNQRRCGEAENLLSSWQTLPAQMADATLAWSLLAGVSKPKVFLGR
jgi:hypothetical protein